MPKKTLLPDLFDFVIITTESFAQGRFAQVTAVHESGRINVQFEEHGPAFAFYKTEYKPAKKRKRSPAW